MSANSASGVEQAAPWYKHEIACGTLDHDYCFLQVDAALAELHGLPNTSLVGKNITDVFGDYADIFQQSLDWVCHNAQSAIDVAYPLNVFLQHRADIHPILSRSGCVVGLDIFIKPLGNSNTIAKADEAAYQDANKVAAFLNDPRLQHSQANLQAYCADFSKVAISSIADWCGWYLVDTSAHAVRHTSAQNARVRGNLDSSIPSLLPLELIQQHGNQLILLTHAHEWGCAHAPMQLLVVPIVCNRETTGALVFARTDMPFEPLDLLMADDLAQRLTLIVERTKNRPTVLINSSISEPSINILALAAHELQTPLTLVLGYAEILAQRVTNGVQLGPREHKMIRELVIQADHVSQLSGALLDVARVRADPFSLTCTPVDLDTLVRVVCECEQSYAPKHMIRYESPANDFTSWGDELRLKQVIHNLVRNAVKYSPNGGNIDVVVRGERHYSEIEVADSGIGIPKEELPHIFEQFYRGTGQESQRQGMGIGLFVVHQIVLRHGGTISVSQNGQQGSKFTVRLPQRASAL